MGRARNLPKKYVFEFDTRFSVFNTSFIHYAEILHHQFDTLAVDPPFLSDECWTKTAETVRWFAKEECKVIVCTGLVMRKKIEEELGCKLTVFEPMHKGGLSNEFGCYTNFDSEGFKWV
ncbi:hypothetical protein HDU98_003191 [Podochytrium sp. JEL0797]|nr:hypothetical protein HDU98_003191 [Podochytrium sp. JEL0797]